MHLSRFEMPCAVCESPVGVFVNTELYATVADQYGDEFVPMCPPCSDDVVLCEKTPRHIHWCRQNNVKPKRKVWA
jgi:hypothetical protein